MASQENFTANAPMRSGSKKALSKVQRRLILLENVALKLEDGRRVWVHDINLERPKYGEYHTLFQKVRKDSAKFSEYCGMSKQTFERLLQAVSPRLEKIELNYRRVISPEERLVVALRYLATGCSFRSLAFTFRMGKTTVSNIIRETCIAIWDVLHETYLPNPTPESWLEVAKNYYEKCNFPNCLGSIDGKNISVICPSGTGSYTINLEAVADSSCRFIVVDIAAYGRGSDVGVFGSSTFYKYLEGNQLNIPECIELPGTTTKMPFVFVGDESYPLLPHLLRPYPRNQLHYSNRIFNYRLATAKRMVECAFGILTSKWRILNKSIQTNVENGITITKTVCLLHNMVIIHDGLPHGMDKYLRERDSGKQHNPCSGETNNPYCRDARNIRDSFSSYFNSALGAVPWQWDMV